MISILLLFSSTRSKTVLVESRNRRYYLRITIIGIINNRNCQVSELPEKNLNYNPNPSAKPNIGNSDKW